MFTRPAWRSRAARRFTPVLATALLTAAVFLLPPTSDHLHAQASAGGIEVSAVHSPGDGATKAPSARE